MHDTAYEHGSLFFDLYRTTQFETVVELGSQNVNGSLRDHCPPGIHYIGLDVMPARGVDLVINPQHSLPLADETVDAVVASSVFEHDICFWDTFLELIRILRPGGLLYLNVPSNGGFHRHPVDCWRFYPDAGVALVQWAARRGTAVELLESFIGPVKAERWADFVAVFRKTGGMPLAHQGRIADHVPAANIYRRGTPLGTSLEAEAEIMPGMRPEIDLRLQLTTTTDKLTMLTDKLTIMTDELTTTTDKLTTATDKNAELSADLSTAICHNEGLSADLAVAVQRHLTLIDHLASAQTEAETERRNHLETQMRAKALLEDLIQVRWELTAIRNSTSWQLTAGLRWMMSAIRGR